jgi:phosphotransferase system enzyme I (PtsI)
MVRESLPNEDEQYEVYKNILESADGMPVTFRTLDAGGDKPISYLHLDDDNSFLGYRSIRFCLAEPEILQTQLKALFRAAQHGPVRILFPMISGLEEMFEVKKLVQDVKRDLRKRKDKLRIPDVPIGIMIEVPAAVQLAHLLIKEVDFFSVGTNDLIQFTLAVDRNNEKVASFFEPFHPAIVHSLHRVVEAAHAAKKWVSICGEMAGNPELTPLLVGLGFDRLSMIPASIPLIKQGIHELSYKKLKKEVELILTLSTADEIKKRLQRYTPKNR